MNLESLIKPASLRHPQSRRAFVEACARMAFGTTVLPLLAPSTALAQGTTRGRGFGSARHIIFLQLRGGMSHIDTFDPKSGSSKGPRGAVSAKGGMQLSEFLPQTARVSDRIAVVRSMSAKVGVHAAAQYLIRTGYEQRGTVQHPCLGAWAQHYLGASTKSLPSSVCINHNSAHGNGFFAPGLSPLPILDPDSGLQHATSEAGIPVLEKRLGLVKDVDRVFREKYPDENVRAYNEFYDATLQLMKSSELKAFDLTQEPAKVRESYGNSKFGRGCLLARRLVQHGVRYVEVSSGNWDMHTGLEDRMEEVGGEFDRGFAALLEDLTATGLLKNTLVVVATEFGRKPAFDGSGRGHYPKAFSTVLAGAGIKRGFVYGATDEQGAEVVEGEMSVGNLHATIGWAAGLPIEQIVMSPSERPFTVGNKSKPVLDLFA
ncbi:MAG: hypothetical protein RLZZ253_1360 [Verrucomicrobiota bacterium]